MNRVKVALNDRSYDIIIDAGVLAGAASHIAPLLPQKRVIIVTDSNVAPLYLNSLIAALQKENIRADAITVPSGENSKTFSSLESVSTQILSLAPERGTTLIALGGGVVGDLTGFCASIILRGLPFIQIPTTLLSQVDSSVGGKTGINTQQGKNLVGSFYQPKCVLIDVTTLSTLPKRELLAGYAEVVKYGLINDESFFTWLESHAEKMLSGDQALLAQAIETSCRAKAAIVARDEKETDVRALLNLGHTFGHALEAETGFSNELLHGEAVAMGMVMAFELSLQLGLSSAQDTGRVRAHLIAAGLKISPLDIRPSWNSKRLFTHMQHDKKVKDGKMTFILAKGIGKSFISRDVTEEQVLRLLDKVLKK